MYLLHLALDIWKAPSTLNCNWRREVFQFKTQFKSVSIQFLEECWESSVMLGTRFPGVHLRAYIVTSSGLWNLSFSLILAPGSQVYTWGLIRIATSGGLWYYYPLASSSGLSFSLSLVLPLFVSDLTTDAFLAALRRFIACRGKPMLMWSDNGSNFIGADHEIKTLYNSFANRRQTPQSLNFALHKGSSGNLFRSTLLTLEAFGRPL